MKTVGLSNKMFKTVLAACGAQAVAFLVNLISSGEFDRVELAQLVGLGLTAVLGAAAGAAAEPDLVAFNPAAEVPGGGPNDGEQGYGIVEAILIVFLVAVCLVVLFHFA